MDFRVQKKDSKKSSDYDKDVMDIAYEFTKKIHEELKEFLKAVVLFGSAVKQREDSSDIDILLIVDDVSIKFTSELAQTYRIIVEKTAATIDPKLHVTSMKFTSFWEYVRAGDPVIINVLRDGYPLIDTGFFDPLQHMLYEGRIKPSQEAIWHYFNRAEKSLGGSRGRLLEGCIDLYWAVIDSTHSALMSVKAPAPSPSHAADLFNEKLVKPGFFDKKDARTIRKFFDLSKRITSREVKNVTGKEYEDYFEEAKEFVKKIKKFLENN